MLRRLFFMTFRLSHSAGNLAAAQTTGACVDMLGSTVNDRLHALHVGLPHAVGTSVRMAHLDAESDTLVAKITLCHLMLHLLAFHYSGLTARPKGDDNSKQLIYNSKASRKMQEKFSLFPLFFQKKLPRAEKSASRRGKGLPKPGKLYKIM